MLSSVCGISLRQSFADMYGWEKNDAMLLYSKLDLSHRTDFSNESDNSSTNKMRLGDLTILLSSPGIPSF